MAEFAVKKSKENQPVFNTARRAKLGLRSSAVGIGANALLCSAKLAVGIVFGSSSIIADGANNLSDVATSVMSLVGFKLAAKPADEKHPFGHGRYEYILSLVISMLIMLMGFELLKSAVMKIFHPLPMQYSALVPIVLAGSILIKLCLGIWNRSLAKKENIPALRAVAMDSLSDCISTAAVLGCALLNRFFHIDIDAYVGAAVALLVLYSGFRLLLENISPLIGKPANKELAQSIREFMLSFDENILGVHDLMLHDYGMGKVFAVAHAEVPAHCSLVEIHEMLDRLEHEAGERFGMELVIHADPVDAENESLRRLKAQVQTILKSVDEHYTLHDFRADESGKHIRFDFIIDDDIKKEASGIEELVCMRIKAVLGNDIEVSAHCEYPFSE